MNKAAMKKKLIIFIAAALWAMIGITASIANAADGEVNLTVKQIYNISDNEHDDTAEYIFKALKAGNPMPFAANGKDEFSFTIKGSQSINIGPIIFTNPGIYRYEISLKTEIDTAVWRVYLIEVHVDSELNAYVIVYYENGAKADEILFIYGFDPTPAPTDPTPNPPGTPDPHETPDPYRPPVSPTPDGHDIEYRPYPPDTPSPPGGDGPKTGDNSNTLQNTILLCAGAALVLGAIIILAADKKAKRKQKRRRQ
ncbi:MAG: hypothetical protein FWH17_09000 [Oscillospiraceae bacterium]|nr:hypothetical protein [Oscillospiraceae bacterium]